MNKIYFIFHFTYTVQILFERSTNKKVSKNWVGPLNLLFFFHLIELLFFLFYLIEFFSFFI